MTTQFEDDSKDSPALDAYTKLMRAADSLATRVAREAAGKGLTPTQYSVLETLYNVGAQRQCDLAEKLSKSGANITMVIDHLEARGLIVRRKEASDRRSTTIQLTAEGRALIAEIFPAHAEFISQQMSALNPDEQFVLGELCRKLGLSFGTRGEQRGAAA